MSEAHIEDHSTPIKTPGQLITVVVLAFVVPIFTIVLIVHMVTGGLRIDKSSNAMSEEAVAARIKPVGEVVLADKSAGGERSGEQIVKEVCQTCHAAGLLNAPKVGDPAAWKPRLAQGEKTLITHAINGIRAMPAKGGNPSLSDAEVARAVVWMANQSGAKFKEPPAPPVPGVTTAAAGGASAASSATTAAPAASGGGKAGWRARLYRRLCDVPCSRSRGRTEVRRQSGVETSHRPRPADPVRTRRQGHPRHAAQRRQRQPVGCRGGRCGGLHGQPFQMTRARCAEHSRVRWL